MTRSVYPSNRLSLDSNPFSILVSPFQDILKLHSNRVGTAIFTGIPDIKVKQFAAEARSLDLASLNDMPERKRLTVAAALIHKQMARSLDGVAEMFIRQVRKLHNKARAELQRYQAEHAERADALVALLRSIALAYQTEGTREERFTAIEAILGPDANVTLENCDAH